MLLASCQSALSDDIERVRVRSEPQRARVVFDLNKEIAYRAFTMSNPHRVVIDIENIDYPRHLNLPSSRSEENDNFEVLAGLRYAVREAHGLRIVLDLNDDIALKHTILPPRQDYGHRLVLDLYRSKKAVQSLPTAKETNEPQRAAPQPLKLKPDQGDDGHDELRIVDIEKTQSIQHDGAKALAILNGKAGPLSSEESKLAVVLGEDAQTPQESKSNRSSTAPEAALNDAVQTLETVAFKPPRDVVIAIDAGHGGHDVGAIGPKGTYEKDIVLRISRELAAAINREHGMRAILTRNKDEYVGLRDRMQRARYLRADLFVSIHADAFRDRRVRGSSVYVLSQNGASSEAARWLAENENAADLVGGVTLGDKDDVVKSVLLDLSQTASIDASIDAADAVLAALKKIGKVHKPTVQKAGFMVLKSPDIPSLLVETAFISNPTEEQRLRSRDYQRKLARALSNGIVEYFNDNPIPETRFAEKYRRQHKVLRGDTLSEIAERYAVSMESIKLANEMSRDRVRLGEVLTIP